MPPVKIYSRKLTRLLQIWERDARPQVNATPKIVLHAVGVPCVAGSACVMLVDNARRHTMNHVCSIMYVDVHVCSLLCSWSGDWLPSTGIGRTLKHCFSPTEVCHSQS